jgi:hypothetical protein
VHFVYTYPSLFLSCDGLHHDLQFVLLQLGARASDLEVNTHDCYSNERAIVDAKFSVLTPTTEGRNNVAEELVGARWQTVELKYKYSRDLGNCAFLEGVRVQILPLFPARNATLITKADCMKTGIGLRAQVLKP